MSTTAEQLGFEARDFGAAHADRVADLGVIRIAQYSSYPRTSLGQHLNVGFASEARGRESCDLRLTGSSAQAKGELLRVRVRGLRDEGALDTLARVEWCRPRHDGRYDIGLALLDTRRPMRVVRPRRAVSA